MPHTYTVENQTLFFFILTYKKKIKLDMIVHTYNPRIWEDEAGGCSILGWPGPQSYTLFQDSQQATRHTKGL